MHTKRSPEEVVERLQRVRASAILRTKHGEAAAPTMEAAIRGGFRVVEFTLTIPGALERIGEFAARDELVVGAGTVLTCEDARAAVEAGAQFLVSPIVDEAIIEEARSLGVAMMPGTHSPTEMVRAHRAGAQMQKLFPGPGLGPTYVRACLGPLPFLRIVPTSGVTLENAARYLEAGAHAVGFVDTLFHPGDIEVERYDRIEARARKLLTIVSTAE